MANTISNGQLKRLQALYGQLARHTQQDTDRAARIAWAQSLVERAIESFKDLSGEEAKLLIDTLQGQLGVKAPQAGKRLDREAAQRAGTEGRRNDPSKQRTLASAADLARIKYALDLLGWSQEQLDGWLRSPRSPLGKRSSPAIRTLYDANRVWWALKNMAVKRGLWKDVA